MSFRLSRKCVGVFAVAGALFVSGFSFAASDPDADKLAELNKRLETLETSCLKAGRSLGEADAHGVFVFSEEGLRAEELRKEIQRLLDRRPDLGFGNERALWGVQPLGAPGTLKLPTEFVNRPVFQKKRPYRPGLVLFGQGRSCAVYIPQGNTRLRALAEEFAWHLEQMCGGRFPVIELGTADSPEKSPAVLFADAARAPKELSSMSGEASIVRCLGETLLIAGRGSGASHAVTYVLEALGCRYLWPGESGKIIPKKSEIVLPRDIDIAFSPKFRLRGVREDGSMSNRIRYSLRRLGFVPEVAFARHTRVRSDRRRPANRGFWQWHGVNDSVDVEGFSSRPGAYVWGHYFGDYVKRYWKDHPEWFALQRDGTRDMSRAGERPTFCLSNKALAEEAARDLIEKFRKRPSTAAFSACLPDGGPTTQCLCPSCRRLDPVNAPPSSIAGHPYVSRTDRAFTFANRIAEGVTAVLPEKRLTFYAYCDYERPPVAVKPHPALILFNVAGEYTVGRTRAVSHRTLAAWSSFGNEMFWRPNVLRGFNVEVPFDFSRAVFEDTELCKANNFIGTDFDCMCNQWAVKGLMCYMTAKALMNPERLSYDDLLDDYCRAGFGKGASDIKAYFAYLAAVSDEVARNNDNYRGSGDKYIRAFDTVKAHRFLDAAADAAAGDDEALRRIRFLRVGVRYAEHEQRCARALGARDRNTLAFQKDFLRFVHDMYADDDALVAVSVAGIGFYNARLRDALNDLEKKSRMGGAVEHIAPVAGGRDRTGDVNAALDRLRLAGGGTLTFASGEYRFSSACALRLSFGISNHDQQSAHPVLFPVWGMTNVTIRAQGARFITDSPVIAFAVVDSSKITFEGFSWDSERPAMSEAVITGFDGARPRLCLDVRRYPFEREKGRLIMTGPNWRSLCTQVIVFDGTAGGIVPGSGDINFNGRVDVLPDGTLVPDLNLRTVLPAAKPGDIVVFRPQRRPSPVFFISYSTDIALRDVVVHDAHGMALLAQSSANISWCGSTPAISRLCGVFPSSGRVSSTHADASHFSNIKGSVVVENCLFEGMMDDAINVHSTCLGVESIGKNNEIFCRYRHPQAVGFAVFRPGDRARFLKRGTLAQCETLPTVMATAQSAPDRVALTLDAAVPDGYGPGDAVENADYQPSVVFRGNIVRNNRARATLFTTPRSVVVEENLFARVSGSAVLLAGDASKWFESGRCEDVVVRDNVFSNCCASAKCHGYCGGVLSIWPSLIRGDVPPYHRNVRITGNLFYSFDVPLLFADAATNVVFSGNTLCRTDDYPGWGKGVFDIRRSSAMSCEPPVVPPSSTDAGLSRSGAKKPLY